MNSQAFPIDEIRAQFPALSLTDGGTPRAYFDGPAGSQVPDRVAKRVARYLTHENANTHGRFRTSRESDVVLAEACKAAADFVGADDPETIVFGANMTTLTFAMSRALANTWGQGDEVIVTEADHDANVSPWLMAARDAGAVVRKVPLRKDTTLDLDAYKSLLSPRTKLVAFGAASNATGTVNPVRQMVDAAHQVGALTYVDAVHYSPHRLPDFKAWNTDFLVCSAYKFFGPHVGTLCGRRELLTGTEAYRVRPAGDGLPDKWCTGTGNHEGIAGTMEAIEYLAAFGQGGDRRARLASAFERIRAYEDDLLGRLIDGLETLSDISVVGLTDRSRWDDRVPTVSILHESKTSLQVADHLAERGIQVWDGNFYALETTTALGYEPDGLTRIGILHYNTAEEVDRLLGALREIEG